MIKYYEKANANPTFKKFSEFTLKAHVISFLLYYSSLLFIFIIIIIQLIVYILYEIILISASRGSFGLAIVTPEIIYAR